MRYWLFPNSLFRVYAHSRRKARGAKRLAVAVADGIIVGDGL